MDDEKMDDEDVMPGAEADVDADEKEGPPEGTEPEEDDVSAM